MPIDLYAVGCAVLRDGTGRRSRVASAQLRRPHLRLVGLSAEPRLRTSAVLRLAALSVVEGEIAVDGLLDAAAAGASLDINGIPVTMRASGDFSTAFDLSGRGTLTVTVTLPLVTGRGAAGALA